MSLTSKIAVVIFLAVAGQGSLSASSEAIDRVIVSESVGAGDASVTLRFTCPHQLLEQTALGDSGDVLVILRQINGCPTLALAQGRQSVRPPPNSAAARLQSVEYDFRLDGEAELHLRFERGVLASVSQSGDLNALEVVVDFAEPEFVGFSSSEVQEGTVTASGSGAASGGRPLSAVRLESLMGEGEAAIVQQDYDRAIQVFTRVLQAAEHSRTPDALELLGLARERNGQTAHAVNEYRRYLELYPNNEGADRVSQRLNGLVTAHRTPGQAASVAAAQGGQSPWYVYGGIQQYYRHDTIKQEGQSSINAQSSILTNADLVLRRQGERIEFSSRFTLGNLLDLLSEDRGPGTQTRFYQGHVEVSDKVTGLSGTAGRQTLRSSGVLGRFDGVHLAWDFRPGMRLNLLGGYPVATTEDGVETNRRFYGAAVEFEDIADALDVSLFYNSQEIDGVEERDAVGTEIRYFDNNISLIGLIDYDIGFGRLNNLSFTGNWNVVEDTSLSASISHRTSPYLTTRNALIGQSSDSIEELLQIYTEDEIFQLAEDRTGEVTSFRLGWSQSLTERFQLNVDVTLTEFEGTTASGGVLEIPDQDSQYYYSLNLVGSSLFMENDSSIMGVRHIDGGTAGTTTLYWDARFPVTDKFRINPRLRVSYRDLKLQDSNSWVAFPSLRLLYRLSRRARLDLEVGSQWVAQDSESNLSDRTSWFVYGGYRFDF